MLKFLTAVAFSIHISGLFISGYVAGNKVYESCDFEVGFCGWSQDIASDDRNWTRWKGMTPTPYTGPSVDHTTNTTAGFYIYMESSPMKQGDKIRLLSPVFQVNLSSSCFEFWYHMFDKPFDFGHKSHDAVGELNIYITTGGLASNTIFNACGNHGDRWIQGVVAIPQLNESFQIILEAVDIFGQPNSDIAIDDLKLGPCGSLTTLGVCNRSTTTVETTTMTAATITTTPSLTTTTSLTTTSSLTTTATLTTTSSRMTTASRMTTDSLTTTPIHNTAITQMTSVIPRRTTRGNSGALKQTTSGGIAPTLAKLITNSPVLDKTTEQVTPGVGNVFTTATFEQFTTGSSSHLVSGTTASYHNTNTSKSGLKKQTGGSGGGQQNIVPIAVGASLGGLVLLVLTGLLLWYFIRKGHRVAPVPSMVITENSVKVEGH